MQKLTDYVIRDRKRPEQFYCTLCVPQSSSIITLLEGMPCGNSSFTQVVFMNSNIEILYYCGSDYGFSEFSNTT